MTVGRLQLQPSAALQPEGSCRQWVVPLWQCVGSLVQGVCWDGLQQPHHPDFRLTEKWMMTAESVTMQSGLSLPRSSASLTAAILLKAIRCFKWAVQQVPGWSTRPLLVFLNSRWVSQQSGQKICKAKLRLFVKARTFFLRPYWLSPPCWLSEWLWLCPYLAFAAGSTRWPDKLDDRRRLW